VQNIDLLLVSPQTEHAKGGIAVWTDTFLKNCEKTDLRCDLLNTALLRPRKQERKRNLLDEAKRTHLIFCGLRKKLKSVSYPVTYLNTSCGTFGMIRDYLIAKTIKRKQPHCKIILQFHCDIEHQSTAGITQKYLKKILTTVDERFVLNAKNAQYLRQKYSAESTVIPNFIDEELVRKAPKFIGESIKNAVFVGFVHAQKGIHELFLLANRLPSITFTLIGEVREDLAQNTLPQNVILLGAKKREEILSILDGADVFVFPTHSEGFSIALLEAMARGLPCVTTNVGANLDMIENQGGRVVDVGDVDAMEQALRQMDSPDTRQQMSEWSVRKVQLSYTTSAVLENIQNRIRSLLHS